MSNQVTEVGFLGCTNCQAGYFPSSLMPLTAVVHAVLQAGGGV